jgi:hypothetical protein
MTENQNTPYSKKCEILADFWMEYRYDEEFAGFVEYADLGLPLAYSIHNAIVKSTPEAERFIEDTFATLLAGLDIQQDYGFEDLDTLLSNKALDGDEDTPA